LEQAKILRNKKNRFHIQQNLKMFQDSRRDDCPPRQNINNSVSDYHTHRRMMEAMPTREEYDLLNNMDASGPRGWTAVDVEARWHDEELLTGSPVRDETFVPFEDETSGHDETVMRVGGDKTLTYVTLDIVGERDPFNDAIDRTAGFNEPLRGDRRSIEWAQAMQLKRKEISATYADPCTFLESYGSATQAAVDDTGLGKRTALASLIPLELADQRYRPRSDREEHQAENRRRFEVSATSQLGRSSYGNYGM
jgi:hypothetical protein